MKLSLKEFFVREAKSSAKSSTKHSSINIDVKSSAQVNIKEAGIKPTAQDKRISTAAKAWKPSASDKKTAALAKRNQKAVDKASVWQDDEANNESLQLEYEDPTSSKRSSDDSKWAGPYADQERMPHVEPQTTSQENSLDGSMEACEDGPENAGSHEDIKKFFGGEPWPKVDEASGGEDYNAWVGELMNHAYDHLEDPKVQEMFAKYVRTEGKDAFETGVTPEDFVNKFFGGGMKEAPDPALDQKRYPKLEPVFKGDENEVPMGSLDDYGTGFGEEDWEHGPRPDQDPYEMKPSELRKWAGADDSPIEKSFMYNDEPQKGHSPFDPNWADTTAFNDDEPVRTSRDSGEGFDDGEDMSEGPEDDEFEKLYADLQGADGPAGPQKDFDPASVPDNPEPDIDWGSLDDEDFINKLAATDMGPAKHKATSGASAPKDTGPGYDSFDEEMTWDEFRAANPEEAEEFEGRFPTEGATFKKKKSGFIHANIGRGKQTRRLFYMGDGRGWQDQDDSYSPTGEF